MHGSNSSHWSICNISQALLAQEEVPPGISRQDEIPGRGLHKIWEKDKHKGWSKEVPGGREDLRDDKRDIHEDTRDIRKGRSDIPVRILAK